VSGSKQHPTVNDAANAKSVCTGTSPQRLHEKYTSSRPSPGAGLRTFSLCGGSADPPTHRCNRGEPPGVDSLQLLLGLGANEVSVLVRVDGSLEAPRVLARIDLKRAKPNGADGHEGFEIAAVVLSGTLEHIAAIVDGGRQPCVPCVQNVVIGLQRSNRCNLRFECLLRRGKLVGQSRLSGTAAGKRRRMLRLQIRVLRRLRLECLLRRGKLVGQSRLSGTAASKLRFELGLQISVLRRLRCECLLRRGKLVGQSRLSGTAAGKRRFACFDCRVSVLRRLRLECLLRRGKLVGQSRLSGTAASKRRFELGLQISVL
jgi:hypothetical protein